MDGEFDHKNLIIDKEISSGGQGTLFLGKYKNSDVIIKRYNSIDDKENKEIQIYKDIKHDYIVEYLGSFIDKDKKTNLVLEKANGYELTQIIYKQVEFEKKCQLQNLSEDQRNEAWLKEELLLLTVREKLLVILQLCEVLIYLKKKKIIHRDIKPGNINIRKYLNNNDKTFYNLLLYKDTFKNKISTMDELKQRLKEYSSENDLNEFINNDNIEKNEDLNKNTKDDNENAENKLKNMDTSLESNITNDMKNLSLLNENDKYYHKYNVELKLFDFGISKVNDKTFGVTITENYSIHYSSPEQYDIKDESDEVNMYVVCDKVDIWALGCLISYMFTGIVPWTNKFPNVFNIQSQLVKKRDFPIPDKWFEIDSITKSRLIELIKLCLKTKFKERINAMGVKKLLLSILFDEEFDSTLNELKNVDSEYYR